MILVSDAAGSKEVAAAILERPGHPDVELMPMRDMPYGDCMMSFKGPQGKVMVVGVEVKKLDDILNCITTGRFTGHQAIGMAEVYDVSILLVQGQWRMNREDGVLETLKNRGGRFNWYPVSSGTRRWMYREFNRWLLVEAIVAGIEIWQTRTQEETVQTLIDLHELGEKAWGDHKTVHDHSRVSVDQLRYRELPDGTRRLTYRRPKLVEKLAIQMAGLGSERAIAVGEHFKTAEEMGKKWMEEKEWRQIPGIGKGLSRKIVEALRGEE